MKNVLKWLDRNLEKSIMLVLLIVIGCTMILQVVMRYVFSNPLPWPEELCRYCFIWSAFLSIGYCYKNDCVLRVDAFLKLFPEKVQKGIEFVADVVVLIFLIYMAVQSFLVVETLKAGNQTSSALGIPMWIIYLASLIGYGIAAFRSIQALIRNYGGKKK